MSKITPLGYTKSKIGRDLAVFFIVFAIVISGVLIGNGMELVNAVPLIVGAVVIGALLIIGDFYSNKKNKANIEYMEKMLKCPYVSADVVEIRKYHVGIGGNVKEVKPDDLIHYKDRDCRYKIFASFKNPNGEESIVESEFYANNPKRFLESDKVRIHYSDANEFWVEVNNL